MPVCQFVVKTVQGCLDADTVGGIFIVSGGDDCGSPTPLYIHFVPYI